jgi:localization factor PodJL
MKPGIPWSVKGIEPEARAAAKQAARRAGITLGEWLNSVILDQSESIGVPQASTSIAQERSVTASPQTRDLATAEPPPPRRSAVKPDRRGESTLSLQLIAQQLAQLAAREREEPEPEFVKPAPPRGEDRAALAELSGRIAENERKTVEALSAVNSRLTLLSQQISGLARPPAYDRPQDTQGQKALESAIRNVIEHIEVSEKRTRDSLKSMQERLAGIAERGGLTPGSDDILRAVPGLAGLDKRLSEMLARIQHFEGLLTERVESVRVAAQQMANQAQSAAVTAARGELRELETRLLAAFQEAAQTAGPPPAVVADIESLRADIAKLARRYDEMSAAVPAERDLQALRVALEQVSTRVAQGPDLRPIAELDRRLGDINQRLDEAMLFKDDQSVLDVLEQKLDAVSGRVEKTEAGLGHLETMERSIRQLYEALDEMRSATRPADTGPSPELAALEDGLRALRESSEGAERRAQDTWRAMQETLKGIVGRIAALEKMPESPPVEPAVAMPDVPDGTMHAESAAAPTPDGDDFIAAARRAAQAAATRPSTLRAEYAALSAAAADKRVAIPSFFGRFRKKTDSGKAGSRRKTLLFAGLLVLLAASYFAVQTLTMPRPALDQSSYLVAEPPFDLAAAVPEARTLLARQGFRVASDGADVDVRMANAIRMFELRSGLKVTGELTPELLQKLREQSG